MLVEKIKRKPRILQATEKAPVMTEELAGLLGRVDTKRWLNRMKEQLQFEIWQLDAELGEYEHYGNCESCRLELQLCLERYLGARSPWWMNFMNGDISEFYPDCPKAKNYDIGYYAHPSEGTLKFIDARRVWAITIVEKQFKAACQLVKILENWDISKGIPESRYITDMIAELAGLPALY